MTNEIKLLTVKKRINQIDDRIKWLIPQMTQAFIPFSHVTGGSVTPSTESLARMETNNPRAYNWLIEYTSLIKEEEELLND